jgi:hypothetical protein
VKNCRHFLKYRQKKFQRRNYCVDKERKATLPDLFKVGADDLFIEIYSHNIVDFEKMLENREFPIFLPIFQLDTIFGK